MIAMTKRRKAAGIETHRDMTSGIEKNGGKKLNDSINEPVSNATTGEKKVKRLIDNQK